MQAFTQKYTIIALLKNKPEDYIFTSTDWPLHMTIVDTFAVEWSAAELIAELTKNLSACKPLKTTALHTEYFGPEQQTQVIILEKTPDLTRLHYAVIDLLKHGGLKCNSPEHSEDGFRPHVSVQPHAKVNTGDEVRINNVALVDMFPDDDPYQRKILKIIKLQNETHIDL